MAKIRVGKFVLVENERYYKKVVESTSKEIKLEDGVSYSVDTVIDIESKKNAEELNFEESVSERYRREGNSLYEKNVDSFVHVYKDISTTNLRTLINRYERA